MKYSVKVKHRRFLTAAEAKALADFGIKAVLNNHVYQEYSAHQAYNVDLTSELLNTMKKTFTCTVVDDHINIFIGIQP
jgi:hypothetical protein